ncbi:MAG: hypothetical protein KBC41_03660 [Candidatus Pacebacteria bacterium]|nr:hypothetical protein [Candidatus Paceibacterota bacterium]
MKISRVIIKNKYTTVLLCFIVVLIFFLYPRNKIIIWVWERNENLTFLNRDTVVAYYAGSVILENGRMVISKRVQPLKLNSDTEIIPVIRIDNFDTVKELTAPRMKQVEDFIIQTCDQNLVVGCQIDFDVKSSERDVYKVLISSVRERLPKNLPLSMTALVSWCDTYSWINDTKIDFAVPMFYRLGSDEQMIRGGYTGKTFMESPKCSSAIGVTTDEPIPKAKYIGNRDIYIFNPHSWTESELKRILKII